MKSILTISIISLAALGQCNKTPVEPVEQRQVDTTARFMVDTVKVFARIDLLQRIEGSGRVVFHFENAYGTPGQFDFTVNQMSTSALVDYAFPLEPITLYTWKPKLSIQDTAEDSVTIQIRILGSFWKPESTWFRPRGYFSWSDSLRVFVNR